MDLTLALVTLLHLFVFVFWVGGDLGAFYASYVVADPRQAPPARKAAARIISAIDMAPRTSLVMALPTGLLLAQWTGWLDVGPVWLAAAWAVSLVWLYVVWAVHLKEPKPGSPITRLDYGLRVGAIAGFAGAALLGIAGVLALPLFLALKLLMLAAAITCGLLVRTVLPAFATCFGRALADPTDAVAQTEVAGILAKVRLFVMGIWAFVTLAAFLGLWQPT